MTVSDFHILQVVPMDRREKRTTKIHRHSYCENKPAAISDHSSKGINNCSEHFCFLRRKSPVRLRHRLHEVIHYFTWIWNIVLWPLLWLIPSDVWCQWHFNLYSRTIRTHIQKQVRQAKTRRNKKSWEKSPQRNMQNGEKCP